MAASRDAEIRKDVQNYYGQVLKTSADLQTNACVTPARPVLKHIQEALRNVHEEVTSRYYGCGLVIPECLENCWILDLGSGSGRDCYALSQLVGEKGHVTGIDMTENQVEVAKRHLDYHMEKFGFQASNVTFIHGCIEKLAEAGIQNDSYDIVVSNCVINLVPDKQQVLQEVYRVLKLGGELYFSDVYASLELPEDIKTHKVLWGECLGGALYWKDLAILAKKIGFSPPRLVTANFTTIRNKELERIVGGCRFVSATFRLFKLPKTEAAKRCQVIYNGGIMGHEKELIFDANFTFKEGKAVEVDGETAAVLKNSRFAQSFLFRPIGGNSPAPGGCSAPEPKWMPQVYLLHNVYQYSLPACPWTSLGVEEHILLRVCHLMDTVPSLALVSSTIRNMHFHQLLSSGLSMTCTSTLRTEFIGPQSSLSRSTNGRCEITRLIKALSSNMVT